MPSSAKPGPGQEGGLEALGERVRAAPRGSPPAEAITSSVREFATVASTARPSAPPTCWEVLISPLASPASRSATPETAAIVTGTNENPSPIAASSDGPQHVAQVAAADRHLAEPDRGPPR